MSLFNEPSAKPDIPATAGTHLVKSGIKLGAEAQTRYHSGVGKLLYLMKWLHPEIANSMHKLTHFMMEAFHNSEKGMERVMQHVLSFPNHGVVMQPGMGQKISNSKSMEFWTQVMQWNQSRANGVEGAGISQQSTYCP